MKPEEILNLKFRSQDLYTEISIRDYFKKQLSTLWMEGERFSGKRPFGNSGWDYEVYTCLIKNGVLPGHLDEDGWIEEFDENEGQILVQKLIQLL